MNQYNALRIHAYHFKKLKKNFDPLRMQSRPPTYNRLCSVSEGKNDYCALSFQYYLLQIDIHTSYSPITHTLHFLNKKKQ